MLPITVPDPITTFESIIVSSPIFTKLSIEAFGPTVIFFPSIEPWGYKLVVSGGAKRVIYNFRGGTYK